ncbi:MAG TPA: carbohydrate porin [Phycisphaerae bacterium]|jgi:porin|nr:carbohydrate porin [Phycisphaerae bacterium]HOB75821.1 carbohydrate porin [Phycisphaerae bacterium]HOJ54552.1 carbohydrate porin [Phycisphaerae bacterium]HOL27055.1 carbohydrate porin [Phycisphaerae bacterium]HPP22147.1 carbohydrate porin [Phycisphaerae bacterium]
MRTYCLTALLGLTVLTCPLLAQESAPEMSPATQPAEVETETWWEGWMKGEKLTGDWGGVREELARNGLAFNIDITQILQHNAHGGRATNDGLRYSGSGDLTITFDTEKAGLWKGGLFLLNAEPKWGDGVNKKVGSLLPVNMDAIKPGADEGCMMTLSEWIYFQNLFDGKLTLIAGKLDGSRAFDRNAFANDERTQFMNLGLRNNPIIGAFAPYTNLGAGFVLKPVDWFSVVTAVVDSQGRAKTTGFETTFHGPTHTSIINEYDFNIKPCGLPGTQRIGWLWSSMEYPHLQPASPFRETGPFMINLLGLDLANRLVGRIAPFNTSPDNVGIYYNFDQYLYTEKCDPTQGIGVFGRFGWAREDVNPINYFYSIGIGGKGVIPDRDKDTFGIGYYHVNLSNDLPSVFSYESGVELFYNIEVCPWLHISPDIQVIRNPGGAGQHDCSLVYGVRMQMNL